MPRKKSATVPEGNGPISMLGGNILQELREVMSDMGEALNECTTKNVRRANQRVASLEQGARQPCLAMEADVQSDTKTRQRTEGAATVVQAMHGDSFSPYRGDPGPKTTSTSFNVKAEPPALPYRDEVLVENGAAVPKSCISPLEMRTTTAAGGLLPIVKTTTATWTTLDRPTPWFCIITEEKNLRTSTPYALFYNRSFWLNQLPALL